MNCNTTHYRANSSSVPGDPTNSWQKLGLKGDETVTIHGLTDIKPRQIMTAEITFADGRKQNVRLLARIDTEDELEYFRHDGILPYVLRNMVKEAA